METRPFSEMRDHGLLWLINKSVFHPRGFALAFDVEDDGIVTGWGLQGDGTESWHYVDDPEGEHTKDGEPWTEDMAFAAVEAFLDHHRPAPPLIAADAELTPEQVGDLKRQWAATQGSPHVVPAFEGQQ